MSLSVKGKLSKHTGKTERNEYNVSGTKSYFNKGFNFF